MNRWSVISLFIFLHIDLIKYVLKLKPQICKSTHVTAGMENSTYTWSRELKLANSAPSVRRN